MAECYNAETIVGGALDVNGVEFVSSIDRIRVNFDIVDAYAVLYQGNASRKLSTCVRLDSTNQAMVCTTHYSEIFSVMESKNFIIVNILIQGTHSPKNYTIINKVTGKCK